jgi:twitching motility protein PilT
MTLETIFTQANKKGASDIHLIAGMPPIFRIEGELKQAGSQALTKNSLKEAIYKMLSAEQKSRFEKEKELDTSCELKDKTRLRVNYFQEKESYSLVARVIPSEIPTMEALKMPDIAYDLARSKEGLVLVTGPTGCGKSTTLASIIERINNERSTSIVTLEDPIEFVYKPKKSIIVQRQIGRDTLSFQEGLKHSLRQDPNVILVGEMRDLETISATITLAETGHLVFATLHTHSAHQTIDRIIDVFPPHQQEQVRLQLSLSLKAVISQHLIPDVKGGQVAARELLINNPAVANLIRENKVAQIKSTIQTSSDEGMFTRDQDLKRLLQENIIDDATYQAYADDTSSKKK